MKLKYTTKIPEYRKETYDEALERVRDLYLNGKISLGAAIKYLSQKIDEELSEDKNVH